MKKALRQLAAARRDALPDQQRSDASAAIHQRLIALPEMAAAARAFVYVSCRSEVQTHELIRELLARGVAVGVPKMVRPALAEPPHIEAWQIDDFAELQPATWGILEPVAPRPLAGPIDVCLAPGLAFTARGDRLGYGRGHYDRFLAERGVRTTIGLAFECQMLPEIPRDDHDRPMDLIVTDERVVRCAAGR